MYFYSCIVAFLVQLSKPVPLTPTYAINMHLAPRNARVCIQSTLVSVGNVAIY